MGDFIVYLSVFVLLFAIILIGLVTLRKIFNVVTIYEYESGIKYHGGRFVKLLTPGQYICFALTTYIEKVDLRPSNLQISGQEIMTKDGVSIKLNLIANYELTDPLRCFNSSASYMDAFYTIIQMEIREKIATMEFDEVLQNRKAIGERILEVSSEKISSLGIKLNSVAIKDITLPGDLKKAFNEVIQARKIGQANLEKARSETAALRNLANAAKMVEQNPYLLQLRLLQTLGESSGNTVVVNTTPSEAAVIKTPEK